MALNKMQLNAVMLGVAAVLGGVAWWSSRQTDDAHAPLATLDAATVDKIDITGRQAVSLEKHDGHWQIVQPFRAPANDNRVDLLLKIPAANSDAHYPAKPEELATYQLNPPNAGLTLGSVHLDFGGVEPLQQRRYVKVGDRVHLVTDNFYHQLTAAPTDYVDKKLLPEAAEPQRIELAGVSLSKDKDGHWAAQPSSTAADANAIQTSVDAWKNARAIGVQLYQPPKDNKRARDVAKITLSDGKSVEFTVLQRQPEAVLARSDWGLQFQLAESSAKPLFALSPAPPKETSVKAPEVAKPKVAAPAPKAPAHVVAPKAKKAAAKHPAAKPRKPATPAPKKARH